MQGATALVLGWVLAPGPLLSAPNAAAGQQQDQRAPQEAGRSNTQMPAGFESRQSSSDLVSENLARATATPDQILAALNKDPRLMVALKTLCSREAAPERDGPGGDEFTPAAVE